MGTLSSCMRVSFADVCAYSDFVDDVGHRANGGEEQCYEADYCARANYSKPGRMDPSEYQDANCESDADPECYVTLSRFDPPPKSEILNPLVHDYPPGGRCYGQCASTS